MTAQKIRRAQSRWSHCGLLRHGITPQEARVAIQGTDAHGRTRKNGRAVRFHRPAKAVRISLGGGSPLSRCHLPRDMFVRGAPATFHHYKFVRHISEAGRMIRRLFRHDIRFGVARGDSRLIMFGFCFGKIHCPLALKVNAVLFSSLSICRAFGIGLFPPTWYFLRTIWIFLREVVDFGTDSNGDVDMGYWAFLLSLSRHVISIARTIVGPATLCFLFTFL